MAVPRMVTVSSSIAAPSLGEVIAISGAVSLRGILGSGHGSSRPLRPGSSVEGVSASSNAMGCVHAVNMHAATDTQTANRLASIRPYFTDRVFFMILPDNAL